jgi:predicted ATPase
MTRQLAGDDLRSSAAGLLGNEEEAELIVARVLAAVGPGEPPVQREEIFWGIRRLFEAAARERPLVLVFEDIHWAEPTLLDLVDYLADYSRAAPVFLLCLARPQLLDDRHGWAGGKLNAASLLLEPLSEPDCETLIDNLVEAAPLDPHARTLIAEAAEGNPLFLEQMLAMLVLGEGGLEHGELAAPPTIQALLAARLDQLGPGERSVLGAAAVVGTDFWPSAVADLQPDEGKETVRRHLETLVRKEFVRPQGERFLGEEAFRFRHSLVRQAAYRSVPKALRASLHERFAAWLESRAGAGHEELVGYHLEQAYRFQSELGLVGEREHALAVRAGRQLGSAGRAAIARDDVSGAVGLLSRAVALLPDTHAERLELLPELGTALFSAGELSRADEVLAEAEELATTAGETRIAATAALQRETVRFFRGAQEATARELLAAGERAAETFAELGDDVRSIAAWRAVALAHLIACRYGRCAAALERALEHAQRGGRQREEAAIFSTLALAYLFGPTPVVEAIERLEEFRSRAKGRRSAEVGILASQSGLYAMAGDLDEARSRLAQARTIVEELGLKAQLTAGFVAGTVELLYDDAVAAEAELRRCYEASEARGDKAFLSTAAAFLADAVYRQGRYDEARALLGVGREAAPADDIASQVKLRCVDAKLLARQGRLDEAVEAARSALELAEATDALAEQGNALRDLAEVLSLARRTAEVPDVLRRAVRLYERKGDRVSAERAAAEVEALTPVTS